MSDEVKESNYGGTKDIGCSGSNWEAQSFTPRETFDLTRIKVQIRLQGNSGDVTLSIRYTDVFERPTGSDLISKTIEQSDIPTSYTYVEFAFATTYELENGTQYAWVIRAPSGSSWNWIQLRTDGDGGYPRGVRSRSNNSGSRWSAYTGDDHTFEVYGAGILRSPSGGVAYGSGLFY